MTVRLVDDEDPPGAGVSELTLFLIIRFAYLAILWIFVLSAISVIRSDMFGARVPEAARGAERRRRKAAEPAARPAKRRGCADPRARSSTAPTTASGADLDDAPILIGRGNDAAIRLDDDYVSTRHARIAALRRPVVRRGPRLHQRHLHRQRPDHPADHPHLGTQVRIGKTILELRK